MNQSEKNHNEIQIKEQKLIEIEMRLHFVQIEILKLRSLINQSNWKQNYDESYALSIQKQKLNLDLEEITKELETLGVNPIPTEASMRLYIAYIRIKKSLNAHKDSCIEVIEEVKSILIKLDEKKNELKINLNQDQRLKVFQDIISWKEILNRLIEDPKN